MHFDLYRLAPGDVAATGFEEILLGPGVKAVEWAERLPFAVPGALIVGIRRRGEEREVRRMIAGRARNDAARGRLNETGRQERRSWRFGRWEFWAAG